MAEKVRVLHYKSGIANICAGVEKFILNLYADTDKSAVEFSLLTRNSGENKGVADMFAVNGIEIYDLGIEHLGINSMSVFKKKLEAFFSEHENEFDFLHMHGCDDPFVIETAKRHGIKVACVHVHQMLEKSSGVAGTVKNFTSNSNIKKADFLFACSKAAGQSYFGKSDFTVLNNGIDTGKFAYSDVSRKEIREEFSLGENETAVCYTGRFERIKNLFFLTDVFSEYALLNPVCRLFFIGDGEQRKELEDYVCSLGLRDKVIFTGQRNDIDKLLCGMDIYLQTSFKEGFSISALEAQCSGLPVLISEGFPSEIEITDLITKKNLSETADIWAKEMLKKTQTSSVDRTAYYGTVAEKGYDTSCLAKKLSAVYAGKK